MRGRTPSTKSKYYLPTPQYYLALHYALNYDIWMAEIRSLRNQAKAIDYAKDKIQVSGDYNATESAAIEINEIQVKIDKIEESLSETSEGLDEYIKLAVCNGFTYTQLTTGKYHMPLNKNDFGEIKHHFYYNLYNKL